MIQKETDNDLLGKLSAEEEKFRLLFELSRDSLILLNNRGYITKVNSRFREIFLHGHDQLAQQHFLSLLPEETRQEFGPVFKQIVQNKNKMFRLNLLSKSNQPITQEIKFFPLIHNKKLDGLLVICRDLNESIQPDPEIEDLNSKLEEANKLISIERERAQSQITELEKLNKLKNEFVSNVSHELRTPLASIVGFAETICTDDNLPPEVILEFNTIILKEGKRLARLINDILDFSKLETEKEALIKSNFDAIKLLRELIAGFQSTADEKNITIVSDVPMEEILINADKERISMAVSHLISNGIKFTNPGGRVTVKVENLFNEIEIEITDTGIGIPEEDLPQLFQKFHKVDRPGSQTPGAGLGLSLVKQIIDLHKGSIRVKSQINKGTIFALRLFKTN